MHANVMVCVWQTLLKKLLTYLLKYWWLSLYTCPDLWTVLVYWLPLVEPKWLLAHWTKNHQWLQHHLQNSSRTSVNLLITWCHKHLFLWSPQREVCCTPLSYMELWSLRSLMARGGCCLYTPAAFPFLSCSIAALTSASEMESIIYW